MRIGSFGWTANARIFRTHQSGIVHESQLLASLAAVIAKEEYEFADDDEFVAYAKQLREAASELLQAAEANDYEQARNAAAAVSRACSDCHAGFRG